MQNKKDWLLIGFAYAMFGVLFWLFASKVGWLTMAKFMGIMISGLLVALVCFAAIVATIYFLTIYRSKRHINFLREHGYDAPIINKQSARAFAGLIIMGIFMSGMSIWLGINLYEKHLCIQEGRCSSNTLGELFILFYVVFAGFMGFMGLFGSIRMWNLSQKQLKQYCEEVRAGKVPKLPRFKT
jgi:hypothetical protein